MLSIEQLVQYRQIFDSSLIKREAKIKLPSAINKTAHVGEPETHHFDLYGYKNAIDNQEHVALISGDVEKFDIPLVRIHSECLTGDVFGSLRCDCGPQLNHAKAMIAKEGGIILYMRQEGRGIGLLNKLKAYELQECGADTVEANHQLGFAADLRRYELSAFMLKDLGISKIKLITNNPDKIHALAKFGIEVIERVPLIVGQAEENISYMQTKKEKMSHLLDKE
ncbi:GTP cyclohydrolase II [Thorsellia kenyensis]|uniref:GTP cyclohydrolase-2 n=1 Tax=Thorsellia kenyensis TaxID=1549888 RepID=A0ABV6CBI0_9GAMM